jgi:ribose transport system ATP-binding protein
VENNIIEARKITKYFGGVTALDKADFQCPAGTIVGLLGENGSGKTTLSRILSGYYKQSSGTCLYKGKVISFNTPGDANRMGIAMVHQNFSLVPDMTVWENIYLGSEPRRRTGTIDDAKIKKDMHRFLERLCPWIRTDQEVRLLPPSELQLIEIVKAFSRNPAFLILDEPTSSLEKGQVESLFSLMNEMKKSGLSMVYISHRMHEVEQICDSICVLRNGQTAGTVDLSTGHAVDYDQIVNLITGNKKVSQHTRRETPVQGPVLLEARDISDARTLHSVSLTIRKGEIVGLAGLQGQGQEELVMALAGFRRMTAGEIRIEGRHVTIRNPRHAIAAGMIVVPGNRQTEGLFMDLPVFNNITFPGVTRHGTRFLISSRREKRNSSRLIADFSIKTASLSTPVVSLSGGNAQKVVVAKWLPLNPKLLLMSDPAKGIDVQSKAELYELICGLAEKGTSTLLYASDLHELATYCDRIFVLYEGRIVDELINNGLNEEYLLSRCIQHGTTSHTEPAAGSSGT